MRNLQWLHGEDLMTPVACILGYWDLDGSVVKVAQCLRYRCYDHRTVFSYLTSYFLAFNIYVCAVA